MPKVKHHEQHDDGSLDDLFQELLHRLEGQTYFDDQKVTRANVINLFDALVDNAQRYTENPRWNVRRTMEYVVRKFDTAKLLQHMRDVEQEAE